MVTLGPLWPASTPARMGQSASPNTSATTRQTSSRAPVAGGNLTTLCHLLGTPYAPAFRDHILFLEDRG